MRSGDKSRALVLFVVTALAMSLLPPVTAAPGGDPVTVALFDFEGETTQPAVVHPAFEVGPMTVNRGTVQFFAGNPGRAMATNQWHEDDNFFEFVVTPPVEGVSLSEFSFDEAGSGTAPNQWAVSIVDDLQSDVPEETAVADGEATGTTSPLVFVGHTVDLTGVELRTEPFAVRLRGLDASGGGGNWRIDNVTLTGETDAVVVPDDGQVVISSLRLRGPDGAGDMYIEIRNVGAAAVDITGWELWACNQTDGVSRRTGVPAGTTLDPGRYFLFTSTSTAGGGPYSGPIPGDASFGVGINDGGGVQLRSSGSPDDVVSAVGASGAPSCTEGDPVTFPTSEPWELTRLGDREDATQVTGNNAADFERVATTPRNSAFDPSGDVLISHIATRGPQGAGYNFVELHNAGVDAVDVSGWQLWRCVGSGSVFSSPQVTFPGGTVMPAGGYILTSTVSYADDPYDGIAPDFTYSTSITDGTGAGALLRDDEGGDVSGVGGSTSDCREGEGVPGGTFPSGTGNNTDQTAFTRLDERTRSTGDNAVDFEGPGQWAPRNSAFDPDAPPELALSCTPPQTITEGFAAEDGEFVDGKAITATASDGTGEHTFTVTRVDPDPSPGAVTVAHVEGTDAEVRFSDDVPGLDPIDTEGTYEVTIEVTDETERSATCDVDVRVVPVLAIGELRGPVADDADGRHHFSPYALGSPVFQPGPPVAVRGVVTQRLLEEDAGSPFDFEGFFIQSIDADPAGIAGFDAGDPLFADGDPTTSDGLWVSTGTFSTARTDQDPFGQYFAEPGDIVTLRGPVIESFRQTTLQNPFVVDVVTPSDSGVDLDSDITVTEVDPPDDVQEASVYWERLAGTQVAVPSDSLVVSGNDFFSPSTSEFWVIRGDHPVAQRENPDHRRVFRDYHPLAHLGPFDLSEGPGDKHGYRILLGSFGIKASLGDATATITPARSGDTLTESRQGGLYFGFDKYQVMVDAQPELARGPDPSASSLGVVDGFDPAEEYSVMVYNVENLYDFRSDPFSGCDLDRDVVPDGQQATSECTADESGGSTVTPPFTYAPRSQAAYDGQRLAIAEQILVALDAPDIITIQEAEKQDVCVPVYDDGAPSNSFMDCDLSEPGPDETMENTDRGSGAPDTVEELALEIFIQSDGEIRYEASGDAVNGRDVRGITQAFLHRTDRVELVPVEELTDDPVLGDEAAIDIPYPEAETRTDVAPWVLEAANPKAVNAELPQSALDAASDLGESIDGGRFPQSQYAFSRAVQVAKFRIYPDGVGSKRFVDRYVTSNHMSAGPDSRTVQRTEQARLNAAVAEAVSDGDGQVLVTGDFNVFPRPDDPFPAFKTDPDREPSDQLAAMYERGFTNLHDVIIDEAPENTYSFIFRGVSQILDHIFVDDDTLGDLVVSRYIHVNTDYPANTPGFEPGRGASDHDPLYARFEFALRAPCDRLPPGPTPPHCR